MLLLLRILQVHASIAAPRIMIIMILTLVALEVRVRAKRKFNFILSLPLVTPIGLPGLLGRIDSSFGPIVLLPTKGQNLVPVWLGTAAPC